MYRSPLLRDGGFSGEGISRSKPVKRTLVHIPGAFCKPSMRVVAYKGAAVVVPAQIVAQHLEGLNLRDFFEDLIQMNLTPINQPKNFPHKLFFRATSSRCSPQQGEQ